MMTSVGSSRARGTWEQTQSQSQTQPLHKQRPQATAEQIRLAQMISDHNDADFEEKVNQLIDITGKNQDACMIAVHDCNGDVNRAINVLLEGNPDTDSWEMVGKKKGVSGQKDSGGQSESNEEGKESRDRERDANRRRGGVARRSRGTSRGREYRGQENGLDGGRSGGTTGRGAERGRRGRGRGRGAGSGRRVGRFSVQGMGTFNPADYADPSSADDRYGNAGGSTWNSTGSFEPDDGARLEFSGGEGMNYPRKFETAPGAWRTAAEEWGTEDWNEDLSETKIFTASNVASMPLPQENVTITAGQRIDLAVLLGKTPSSSLENEPGPLEVSQPPSLSQSLVFSSSKQSPRPQAPSSGTSFPQHNMVSMLGKGFGDVGEPKGGSGGGPGTTSGSQFLEQFKTAQALAQLASQHSQPGAGHPPAPSSWELGATQPSSLGQYDLKTQSESSPHSPFAKRQSYQPSSSIMEAFMQQDKAVSLPSATAPPSSPLSSKPSSSSAQQQISPGSSDHQSSSPQPTQQHKLKQQKKRTAIQTKIPALAVEMPGTSDVVGLNLQFGALQFGSEPALPEYESAPATSAPAGQTQNSLCTSAASESASVIPSNPSQEPGYQCSVLPPASTYPPQQQQGATQATLYEQRATQTRRYPSSISSSPQKELHQSKNGFSVMQTTQAVEVKTDSPPVSSMSSLPDSVSAASSSSSSSLLITASPHSSTLSHSEDLPSTAAPPAQQHSSSLSTQQNSVLSSSFSASVSSPPLLHASVDSEPVHHTSSSAFSSSSSSSGSTAAVSSCVLAVPQPVSVTSSSLGPVSSLGLSANSGPVQGSARSSLAPVSGKAPPNLPPGVPPLLPSPYIMAPGLLHAYPVSFTCDLSSAPVDPSRPGIPYSSSETDRHVSIFQIFRSSDHTYIIKPVKGLHLLTAYCQHDLPVCQRVIRWHSGEENKTDLLARILVPSSLQDYYSIPFATQATALTGRDGSLTSNPYPGDLTKFGRGDASSPSPATTLAQPQQNQPPQHHGAQQTFLNPALPPGYSYTSLPYYTGVPGLPNAFQYGPAMFPMAPTSSKQHAVNVNASAAPFQQASGYGSHAYNTGYDELSHGPGAGDFCKGGYSVAAAAAAAASGQSKSASATAITGPTAGVSVTSSNTGVPDISGSVYTKTQSFDKQGFHTGTPAAAFNLPSALGSGGPMNPGTAAGYPPAPFMHILAPHQQQHSQILHHHVQQDGQSGSGQRSQVSSMQQKSQLNKTAYNIYNWGSN
ncbi:ubiquitin-associated protein 2-like [Polyodon spathula]|uniref:ubiquitin-associated protein 2-like n=1 Tax=Polyodon spathula TaxID=7913 RepID=UPI001B7DDD8E|nr:ubiquitin-associated protein 2-like [Polyodon spathula]